MLTNDSTHNHQAREIELELIRVRSAAEAARLDARAAELELMLRRMARVAETAAGSVKQAFSAVESQSTMGSAGQGSEIPDSWSKRLARLQSRDTTLASIDAASRNSVSGQTYSAFESQSYTGFIAHGNESGPRVDATDVWRPKLPLIDEANAVNDPKAWSRLDAGSSNIPLAHLSALSPIPPELELHNIAPDDNIKGIADRDEIDTGIKLSDHNVMPGASDFAPNVELKPDCSEDKKSTATPKVSVKRQSPIPIPKIETNDNEAETEPTKKFRPASLLVSTLAHIAVLVFLGLMTLASNPPKDQLAFTSSVSESSEESVETFEIESSEPTEPTEPVSETAYEVSEMGTMAITEVSMDAPPALATPSTSDLFSSSSSSLSSSAMKSLKGDATAKTQFCGVDGGGSHFVYLVDSSGSMRDGFQSARDELLASIDQLKPDQRFYVVFFDDDPAYMRISDPSIDEPASVMATPENKKRLRIWAMTVQMDKGKAPYDVLPFALSLRPDVIFLLSDGEFPTKIEEILREQNHEENLFGESGPISIVHTIRYHGMEGQVGKDAEATMVKIAKENGGQYRHVPKPKP